MSMYKRPLPHVRNNFIGHKPVKITEGSFLHGILNPGPVKVFKFVPGPVYEKKAYLVALEKHYNQCGIPFKYPQLPDYVRPVRPERRKEPSLCFGDQVYLKMKILKSGIVRIKLDTSIATLYEQYYSKAIRPPSKCIIQAYKSMGFSEQFLDKIKRNFVKKVKEQKRIETVIDKLFNKKPVKKVKKKKEIIEEEEKEIDIVNEEVEEVEEDDTPGEDDGLDVEPDPEEDVEEEPVEEEYNSD
jgi:hypothetical protein